MTLPVVWLPEADAELKEALARYGSIRPELAQRFAEAVAGTIGKIAATPLHYAVAEKGTTARRRAPIPLWDILPRERDANCGDCLFPRAA